MQRPVFLDIQDGFLAVLPSPVQCRRCFRMVLLLVNRSGVTRCAGCDEGAR